ncbi:MAG TPA: hypothetical protein PKC43_01045 [Phycisphaerales bacterium]|nr:hypothetical protein [Phycisphaerales bacterium]HMP36012.1 hypothetical protein [Phycisphaerales bacterium]
MALIAMGFAAVGALAVPQPTLDGPTPTPTPTPMGAPTPTHLGDCFGSSATPDPSDPKCRTGIDSFPCIDPSVQGDATPDPKAKCGWKRRFLRRGSHCGRQQLLRFCMESAHLYIRRAHGAMRSVATDSSEIDLSTGAHSTHPWFMHDSFQTGR